MKVYQDENNNNPTKLEIYSADLQNNGVTTITSTLRTCSNLTALTIRHCGLTDEQLLIVVEAIREHNIPLENLVLGNNTIGNAGCRTLAGLLESPNCNLNSLCLVTNPIGNVGAISIANSLVNNTRLTYINLYGSLLHELNSAGRVFSELLCNNSSINSLHSSNHTIDQLIIPGYRAKHFRLLHHLNDRTNKRHVAILKILRNIPNIDMSPLFGVDLEDDLTLKALPHVIAWFQRASEAVAFEEDENSSMPGDDNEEQKLSAIYQFVRAMPLMFVPPSHIKVENKKRKRTGSE